MNRSPMIALMAGMLFSVVGYATAADDPAPSSAAGMALESIFDPQRAPSQKTMGLLQRSFLDLVESSHQELQVALVIDGTDSMAADIAGVRAALRAMVNDLRQYKGDRVTFAVVIYRDTGSPSGAVELPLKQFTADEKLLSAAFEKVVPESGAPYFLELVDLGVHEALDKLNWSSDPDVSKWLLLFGDAPPYDANFVDQQEGTGARRRFDTDLLVNLAKRKAVQISCVLCTSREEERAVYERVLDKTRRFMNTLATNTGGLMLDLSYPDIRAALMDASRKPRVERQPVGTITRQEIEAARRAVNAAALSSGQRLRVAILPHMPLAQLTFDPSEEAVQMATELRHNFKSIPRTEVCSPVDIERAVRRVKAANVAPEHWLQAIAVQLRAHYVVWGEYQKNQGAVRVKSAVYAKSDGHKVLETTQLTSPTVPVNQLAGNVVRQLTLAKFDPQQAPELRMAFSYLQSETAWNDKWFSPMAGNDQVRTVLLAGFESLEQSLAFPVGDAAGVKLLDDAEKSLVRAAEQDVRNPLVHLALANCYFNQAQAEMKTGRSEKVKGQGEKYLESLKRAYRERENSSSDLLKTEIEADYNLLIKKDIPAAVQLYTSLTAAPNDGRLHSALRAHWMLAGIFSGDWGVDAASINAASAREHFVFILAHWPDSHEASFIKSNLRWSDEKGRNQFEHFPLQNKAVLPAT